MELGCSAPTVRRWIHEGHLAARKIGPGRAGLVRIGADLSCLRQELQADVAGQVYCPPTERDRERAKHSQPRSRCAKRPDNAKQRGRAHCGKRCVPGENVPVHATRFCSRAHKRAYHHALERAAA